MQRKPRFDIVKVVTGLLIGTLVIILIWSLLSDNSNKPSIKEIKDAIESLGKLGE